MPEFGFSRVRSGRIEPLEDSVYDIGKGALRWKDIYLSGKAYASEFVGTVDYSNIRLPSGVWTNLNADELDGYHASDFAPASHTHSRSDITDFFSSPFWDNIPDKPFSSLGSEFAVSGGELQVASIDFSKIANRLSSLITFDSSLVPNADGSYDLGNSSYRWRDGYFSGWIRFTNDSDDVSNIQIYNSSGQLALMLGVRSDGSGRIDANVPIYAWFGGGQLNMEGGTIFSGNIYPNADNAYNLGNNSFRWKDGHFAGTVYAGALDVGGLSFNGLGYLETGISAYKIKHNEGSHPTELHDFIYRFVFKYLNNFQAETVITDLSHTWSDDKYTGIYATLVYVANDGYYDFGVNSDDSSAVFVDGVLACAWLSGHATISTWYKTSFNSVCSGWCDVDGDGHNEPCFRTLLHPNGIYLTKGWHLVVAVFEEIAGGDKIEVYIRPSQGEDPSTAGGSNTGWALIGDSAVSAGYILDYKTVSLGTVVWMLSQYWKTSLVSNPERNVISVYGSIYLNEKNIENVGDFIKFTGGSDKIFALQGRSGCKLYIENSDRLGAFRFDIPNDTFYSRHICPLSDNAYDLGKSDYRWRNLWLSGSAYIGGNVGIGTSSPVVRLHVAGASTNIVRVDRADGTRMIDVNVTDFTGSYGGAEGVLNLEAREADDTNTTRNSPAILLRGRYWNGSASVDVDFYMLHKVTGTYSGYLEIGRGSAFLRIMGDGSGTYSRSVLPLSDNTYDLGKSDYRWRNIYYKGTLYGGSAELSGAVKADWSYEEVIYVSPSGGGDGSSSSSPTTLDDALSRAKARRVRIYLADGEYHISKSYVLNCDYVLILSLSGDPSSCKIVFDSYVVGSSNASYRIELLRGVLKFYKVTIENGPKVDDTLGWAVGGGAWCPLVVSRDAGSVESTLVFHGCIINQTRNYFVSAKHGNGNIIFSNTTINMSGDAVAFIINDYGTVSIGWYNSSITSGYKLTTGLQGRDVLFSGNINFVSASSTWFSQVPESILPRSNNTYDLGNESYKWRNGYFAGTVYASQFVGNIDWSYIQNAPLVGVVLAFDDTEATVTGTTETEVKYFRFVRNSSFFNVKRIRFIVSGYSSSGTGKLKVYIDGTAYATIDLTSTSEGVYQADVDISSLSDGIHTVSIRLVGGSSSETVVNNYVMAVGLM